MNAPGSSRLKSVWLCLLLLPALATADLAREWRSADEAAPATLPGAQIWLQAGSDKFWAIYRQTARKEPRGAAIILPDAALRPVAAQWIEPLAVTLRQFGWDVLLLQAPQSGEPFFPRAAAARLEASVAFLVKKQHRHMALLGVGDGAVVALDYAAQHPPPLPPSAAEQEALRLRGVSPQPPPPAVRIAAALDLPWDARGQGAPLLDWLGRIRIPLADYFPVRDGGQWDEWAKQRQVAAKANEGYRQLRFQELDPSADAERNMLAHRLAGWMGNAMRAEVDKWPKLEKNQAPAGP